VLRRRLRSWKKLSLIGAWSVSPKRRRVDWCCDLQAASFKQEDFVEFLRGLLRRWREPIVVIWNNLPGHLGHEVRQFENSHQRLHIEHLPKYAPELNPNEYAWGYLKRNLLPRFCPDDLHQLHVETWFQTLRLSGRDQLLRSFLAATKLPFRWPP
jgi:transposase